MWLIIGLVLGAGLFALVSWLRNKNISVNWYEWLIGIVGLALLVYTIQNITGSFAEFEPTAAWLFLLVLGLPAVILMVVAWQLVARRQKAG